MEKLIKNSFVFGNVTTAGPSGLELLKDSLLRGFTDSSGMWSSELLNSLGITVRLEFGVSRITDFEITETTILIHTVSVNAPDFLTFEVIGRCLNLVHYAYSFDDSSDILINTDYYQHFFKGQYVLRYTQYEGQTKNSLDSCNILKAHVLNDFYEIHDHFSAATDINIHPAIYADMRTLTMFLLHHGRVLQPFCNIIEFPEDAEAYMREAVAAYLTYRPDPIYQAYTHLHYQHYQYSPELLSWDHGYALLEELIRDYELRLAQSHSDDRPS